MGHDVFISYSNHDRTIADAACARLEQAGHRCWIAPRDVGGGEWGKAIVEAIRLARVFVLIFSAHANRSPQVNREVERAVSNGLPILPFRIENIAPSDSLEYFISNQHWLDALTPPIARHLDHLAEVVGRLLGGGTAAPPPPPPRSMTSARRTVPFILAAAMAAIVGGAVWTAVQRAGRVPPETATSRVQDENAQQTAIVQRIDPPPRPSSAAPAPLEDLLDSFVVYFTHSDSRVAAAYHLSRRAVPTSISGVVPASAELTLVQLPGLPGWELLRPEADTMMLALETHEIGPASFTLRLSQPVREFRFTMPGLVPHGAGSLDFPAFSAIAYDEAGDHIATVDRTARSIGPGLEPVPAQTFTLTGPGARIRTVRFDTHGVLAWGNSGDEPARAMYLALLIDAIQVRRAPRGED